MNCPLCGNYAYTEEAGCPFCGFSKDMDGKQEAAILQTEHAETTSLDEDRAFFERLGLSADQELPDADSMSIEQINEMFLRMGIDPIAGAVAGGPASDTSAADMPELDTTASDMTGMTDQVPNLPGFLLPMTLDEEPESESRRLHPPAREADGWKDRRIRPTWRQRARTLVRMAVEIPSFVMHAAVGLFRKAYAQKPADKTVRIETADAGITDPVHEEVVTDLHSSDAVGGVFADPPYAAEPTAADSLTSEPSTDLDSLFDRLAASDNPSEEPVRSMLSEEPMPPAQPMTEAEAPKKKKPRTFVISEAARNRIFYVLVPIFLFAAAGFAFWIILKMAGNLGTVSETLPTETTSEESGHVPWTPEATEAPSLIIHLPPGDAPS